MLDFVHQSIASTEADRPTLGDPDLHLVSLVGAAY
jgi:hypothetical protein